MAGREWQPFFREGGVFDLTRLNLSGSSENAAVYLSFWVSCPRSLEDLLSEPNLPQVNLEITKKGGVQVWLNDEQQTLTNLGAQGAVVVAGLKLRAEWNHFLVRLVHNEERWQFSARFTASQPEFLAELDSALEKP